MVSFPSQKHSNCLCKVSTWKDCHHLLLGNVQVAEVEESGQCLGRMSHGKVCLKESDGLLYSCYKKRYPCSVEWVDEYRSKSTEIRCCHSRLQQRRVEAGSNRRSHVYSQFNQNNKHAGAQEKRRKNTTNYPLQRTDKETTENGGYI